ncbi:MAG: sodium:proton antiporter [Betaproteobacteria bacterium]|nr:sodium:proton antiporter [Betaproteobacteria bacterium]
MTENAVVAIALIGGLAAACQWLAWRVRLPAIVFLLLAGIVAGPVTGIVRPTELFGGLLFPLVSLGVAVILFEGALTLKFSDIAGLERVVRRMVTTGMLVTWAALALAARWLAGFSWEMAALFGGILVVTGPTVIVPMLRTVRPTERVANILRWEGIVIDPVGALLAVLVFEFIVSAGVSDAFGQTLLTFLKLVVVGVALGVAVGYALGEALRHNWIPGYQFNVATLTAVFAVFAISNASVEESGLLAVTVMGIFLANRKGVPIEEILEFKESLSLILIGGLFILLAASLDLARLGELGWVSLQVLAVAQFVARPLQVLVSTWGSALSWRERTLLAWIAPRGIVAAAVSALFALQLEARGFAQAELLVPLTFVVIIGTVVLQSFTAGPLARALKVSEPEPVGFLVLGAHPLARAIARALVQNKIPVLLADAQWDNVSRARMDGLRAYYGNPLSEHAELYLDLAGLGQLLALSPDTHLNELACARYRRDFEPRNVYALRVRSGKEGRATAAPSGRDAFGEEASYAELSRRLVRGAELRTTKLTEAFGMKEYSDRYAERAVPLFAIDPKGRVEVFASGAKVTPGPEWSVIALVDADAEGESREGAAAAEAPVASA